MKFSSNNQDSSPREVPPAKTYPARLVGIYDIGLQKGFEAGDAPKNKVVFIYDLLGKERQTDGKVFSVIEFLTVSMHAKGTLPKRIKALGGPIKRKSDDWFDLPADYALSDLLGNPCMIEVAHSAAGKAKVNNVIEPMEGMAIPEPVSEIGYIDLDADDWIDHYSTAPKWIKSAIDVRLDA